MVEPASVLRPFAEFPRRGPHKARKEAQAKDGPKPLMPEPTDTRGAMKRRLAQNPGWRGWECAAHEIETAPGYIIYVTGWLDGKRQTIAIDPADIDELARYLHQAKRISRGKA